MKLRLPLIISALLMHLIIHAETRWEGVIYAEDTWSYNDDGVAVDANWKSISFDDSNWPTGQGGFGYGDGDDNTTVNQVITLYSRIDFEVTDKSQILEAILHADFDDGIIVYLNGYEIARSSITETNPSYDTFAENHEASMYNGGNPTQFTLTQDHLSLLINGTNTLAVEVHNQSATSSDLSSIVYLTCLTSSPSPLYKATPSFFEEPEIYTSTLPMVIINTSETISKEGKVTAHMKIVNNESGLNTITDPGNEYDGFIGIRIRGNQSASYDQKPYSIETRDSLGENNNVSLFGLPKENDWVLLNNGKDLTCINHALGYEISRKMGFWAAHTLHCEVFLNGSPQGIYVFGESLKRDDGRIDIAKLYPEEVEEPNITGGYIFKVDYFEEDYSDSWQPTYQPPYAYDPLRYVYHTPDPEDIVPEQEEYIQDWVDNFEEILFGNNFDNPETGYRKYINVPSFINYLLVNEVALNVDAYKKSHHYHKDKDRDNTMALLNAGPVWDFDWGFRDDLLPENPYSGDRTGFEYMHAVNLSMEPTPNGWMYRLMEDEQFANEAYTTYAEFRDSVLSEDYLMHYIDSIVEVLTPALERHYDIWYNEGAQAESNYLAEVQLLKDFLNSRLEYIEDEMTGEIIARSEFLPSPVTLIDSALNLASNNELSFGLWPNPCSQYVYVEGEHITRITIVSIQGVLVLDQSFKNASQERIELGELPTGIYLITITNSNGAKRTRKLHVR